MTVLSHWFAQPWAIWLLGLVPLLGLLSALAHRWRRRMVARWGIRSAREALSPAMKRRRTVRGILQAAGIVFLVIGIAGPRWGHVDNLATASGRDVVVVLDLSRSMLAQDVLGRSSPDRLGQARDAILELSDYVRRRGGHRLALVVFAGRPQIVCPLTHDYDHFRQALVNARPDDPFLEIGIEGNEAVSGTRIGAALRTAVELSDVRFAGFHDVLLISDGDDPAGDMEWRNGISAAKERGVRVDTVGIGAPDTASLIPNAEGGHLGYDGKPIQTRLSEKPLEEIARQTGGSYVPGRTAPVALGEVFRSRIESRPSREQSEDVLPAYRQHSAWFFAGALVCMALAMSVSDGRQKYLVPGESAGAKSTTEAA